MSTTLTSWPDRSEFLRMMQAPDQFIEHGDLHGVTIERRMGRVLSWNGQRTIVFRGHVGSRDVALRCPLADDDAGKARYCALKQQVTTNPVDPIVHAEWIPKGLRYGPDRWVPLMMMEWVDGAPIDAHVTNLVDNDEIERIRALADGWRSCCESLRRVALAHGDVHAGNVMVRSTPDGSDELVLIDYDAVWVPGLDHPAPEVGTPAFQHPRRCIDHWGRDMDAFSNVVMYLSLRATANDTRLWMEHHQDDDTMLFDNQALREPAAPVWSDLLASTDPDVVRLTECLRKWLRHTPNKFDSLEAAAAAAATVVPGPKLRQRGSNVWISVDTQSPSDAASRPAKPAPWAPTTARRRPRSQGTQSWPPSSEDVERSESPGRPGVNRRWWALAALAPLIVLIVYLVQQM